MPVRIYLILKMICSRSRQNEECVERNHFPKRIAMISIVPDKKEGGWITVAKKNVAKLNQ